MAGPHSPTPPRRQAPTRFLVDAMLGNVARDLRLLGYDAAYRPDAPDPELLRCAQAEGRVLVTRDRALADRCRGVRCVLVSQTRPRAQAAEVLAALALGASPEGPFSRCLACGGALAPTEAADALPDVPDHVAGGGGPFSRCGRCRRVYWRGSHAARLEARIREVLGPLHPRCPRI